MQLQCLFIRDTVEATQVALEQSLPDFKLDALKTAYLVLAKYYRMLSCFLQDKPE